MGLKRWLCSEKHFLLLWKTQVLFPEPILGCSQLPESLVLLEFESICLNDAHTPPTRYILIIIIKNNKCF